MAGNPAPDWYPDPQDPAILRWWDGARWSGETRSAAAAAGPGLPPGSPAVSGQPGPAPFGGMENPRQAIPVTGPAGQPGAAFPGPGAGMPGPGGESGDPGGPGADGMHASWRDPAVQAWAAVYQAAGPAAGKDRFPVRSWVLGGAAAAVIAGVAAWFLVGALGGGGHPAGSRAFRGGAVTDRAAGISFRVPAGAGWARVARPGDGFTLMLRAPAPGARTARTQPWAVAASEPLPAAIAYHGTAQLRADGILAAEAVARRYFPGYRGKPDTSVRRQAGSAAGRPAYVVTFRIGAASGRAGAGQAGATAARTAAVVIVSRGTGKRPGLLFVTVPDAMSVRLAAQIAGTARPAG